MARPEDLAPLQHKKFGRYRDILSKDKSGDKTGFWDVVVITASDDEQALIYREQVRWRQELGQIPTSCSYHVVPDPPGCKIGNGGATLVVLDYLRQQYKDKMSELKYLLIHAGGYSQRTPQHSVCGKIFAPLPVGPLPGSSMLEMCFAMLCDIPPRVAPGAVMIKCGDDVIIFDSDVCHWHLPGFTALAHRSPVDIALTHGVFCLDLPPSPDFSTPNLPTNLPTNPPCRRFTHKPSLEKMRRFNALVNEEREAFTDSTFLFDTSVAARLLEWWDTECAGVPPPVELDAYGDMLQACGPEADAEYLPALPPTTTHAGSKASNPGVYYRRSLYEALRSVRLNVALPPVSRFWHIGTIPEILDHFCYHTSFLLESGGGKGAEEDGLAERADGSGTEGGGGGGGGGRGTGAGESSGERPRFVLQVGSQGLGYYAAPREGGVGGGCARCVMCSRVAPDTLTHMKARSVLEYSLAPPGVRVGRDCFLSSVTLPPHAHIPDGTFLQTVSVRRGALEALGVTWQVAAIRASASIS
jgi:hypothetical protein